MGIVWFFSFFVLNQELGPLHFLSNRNICRFFICKLENINIILILLIPLSTIFSFRFCISLLYNHFVFFNFIHIYLIYLIN